MELSPDDIECLIAVGKRSTLQDKWLPQYKDRLVSMGLITMDNDWPTLTTLAKEELDKISRKTAGAYRRLMRE